MTIEQLLAGVGAAVCIGWLLWMLVGHRVPTASRSRLRTALRGVWHWPHRRRAASEQARQAIERARRGVERDGNVYRPKSFSGKPPADDGDRSDNRSGNDKLH